MTERTVLFYSIIIALLYLAFATFAPFMLAILSAVVFAMVSFTAYDFMNAMVKNANIAASAVVMITLLLFVAL